MATKRSSTKPHKFTGDVLLREGITSKPTQKSANASETINALVLVRRFRLLQTRKIVNPFPVMARNERTQPRIQNQISILAVKGSFVKYEIIWSYLYSKPVNYFRILT